MPLLSVNSSLQGQTWMEASPPTLPCCYAAFCSLLARKNLLRVVVTALQSLKTPFSLFLPSASSGQFVFLPGQNCTPCRHGFAKILAHSRGYEASHACQAGAKLAPVRALLAQAAAALGLQVGTQWDPATSEFKVRGIWRQWLQHCWSCFPSVPYYCGEVNPIEKLKPCPFTWQANTPSGWPMTCCPNAARSSYL